MAVFAGTVILNSPGVPAQTSVVGTILTVPPGNQYNLAGLAFSNALNAIVAVSVFRNTLSLPPAFTINVPALAGQGAVAVAQQAYTQVLGPGETLYFVTAFAGQGYITVEADGLIGRPA